MKYINLRCFYLRLLQKLPLVLLITLAGAAAGLLVYFFATTVFGPGIMYETGSTLYIDFAYDPERGTLVDYYNAYTWNTLMGTDEICNELMGYLSEEYPLISKEEVLSSIDAAIPSDTRVMVLTVTNSDKELAVAVTGAARHALESYGRTNPAFDSIKLLTEDILPSPIIYDDRSRTAAILGAIIFFLGTVMVLLIIEAMNDAVYVPEEAEKIYGVPVLGVLLRAGKNKAADTDKEQLTKMLHKELKASLGKLSSLKHVAVVSAEDYPGPGHIVSDDFPFEAVSLDDITKGNVPGYASVGDSSAINAAPAKPDGVIVAIRYGKHNRAMTEHILSQLRKNDLPVPGLLITDADPVFLRLYYGKH